MKTQSWLDPFSNPNPLRHQPPQLNGNNFRFVTEIISTLHALTNTFNLICQKGENRFVARG